MTSSSTANQQMRMDDTAEAVSLDALSIALQHSALAADQQNVCRLLQVSKSWRSIVQQSAAALTNAGFKLVFPYDSVTEEMILQNSRYFEGDKQQPIDEGKLAAGAAKLADFTQWVTAHAGLLRSITIKHYSSNDSSEQFRKMDVIDNFLVKFWDDLAMRLVAASNGSISSTVSDSLETSSATSKALPVTDASVKPLPLQLKSFCTPVNHFPPQDLLKGFTAIDVTPKLLSALPAATLTKLVFSAASRCQATYEALMSLTNLRSLGLYSVWSADWYLNSIKQLSKLTSLIVEPLQRHNAAWVFGALPQQLCVAQLVFNKPHPIDVEAFKIMAHATSVQQLGWVDGDATEVALQKLPVLQELVLDATRDAFLALDVSALTQLQRVTVYDLNAADLMCLARMPALQHITLIYQGWNAPWIALEAACAWSKPPIKELAVCTNEDEERGSHCSAAQAIALIQSMSALSQVTRLFLGCYINNWKPSNLEEDPEGTANCLSFEPLRHLTQLQHLDIITTSTWTDPVPVDSFGLQHLSCLTNLTYLGLYCDWQQHSAAHWHVNVLSHLTTLEELFLDSYGLPINSVMPAISNLTKLTSLSLYNVPKEETEACLRSLTELSRLEKLCGFHQCNLEVMQQFWPSVCKESDTGTWLL